MRGQGAFVSLTPPFVVESDTRAHVYRAKLTGELDLSKLPPAEQKVIRKATALNPDDGPWFFYVTVDLASGLVSAGHDVCADEPWVNGQQGAPGGDNSTLVAMLAHLSGFVIASILLRLAHSAAVGASILRLSLTPTPLAPRRGGAGWGSRRGRNP